MKRFWDKVNKTDGCWDWIASINSNGYGTFRYDGITYGAHVMALLLDGIQAPKGMCVCHKCDNRLCVRPSHLFVGTTSDNHNDMYRKGRCNRAGEKNGRAKLTNQQIKEIIGLHKLGLLQEDIALLYNVSSSTISYWVCKGRTV